MKINLKKIVLTGILSSLAIISFMIENLLPPLIVPGARIGVSNIFILLCLIIIGVKYSFIALFIKVILGSIFSGNISALMYSLPAGVISLSIESLLLCYTKKFSIISVSIISAIINCITQNIIFCLIIKSFDYMVYLPYLAIISTIGGLSVGIAVYLIIKILPYKTLQNILE